MFWSISIQQLPGSGFGLFAAIFLQAANKLATHIKSEGLQKGFPLQSRLSSSVVQRRAFTNAVSKSLIVVPAPGLAPAKPNTTVRMRAQALCRSIGGGRDAAASLGYQCPCS